MSLTFVAIEDIILSKGSLILNINVEVTTCSIGRLKKCNAKKYTIEEE